MSVPTVSTSKEMLAEVQRLEEALKQRHQVLMPVEEHLHAGLYSRTIRQPEGVVGVSVTIRVPTLVIVVGHVLVTIGDTVQELDGVNVLEGAAMRKTAWRSLSETFITMAFATRAETVEAARAEFTDEQLMETL